MGTLKNISPTRHGNTAMTGSMPSKMFSSNATNDFFFIRRGFSTLWARPNANANHNLSS